MINLPVILAGLCIVSMVAMLVMQSQTCKDRPAVNAKYEEGKASLSFTLERLFWPACNLINLGGVVGMCLLCALLIFKMSSSRGGAVRRGGSSPGLSSIMASSPFI